VSASLFKTKRQQVNAAISAALVCVFIAAAVIYQNATESPCDVNRYSAECAAYLRENPSANALGTAHQKSSTKSDYLRSTS
jgi:hypothetical protein